MTLLKNITAIKLYLRISHLCVQFCGAVFPGDDVTISYDPTVFFVMCALALNSK